MKTYNAPEEKYEVDKGAVKARVFPLAKIFIYFALGLLVTGAVGYGWPYIIGKDNYTAYMISTIIASIAVFPLMLFISIKAFKPKTAVMSVLYFTYAAALGILISSVFMMVSYKDIMIAFLITGGAMLVMGVIGILFKNIGVLIPLVTTALIGVLVISLVNYFFYNEMVYWVTDFVFFGLILIMTAIDINRIKQMSQAGWLQGENNLAIYAAYTLLTDFIMIFIRVAMYLGLASSN